MGSGGVPVEEVFEAFWKVPGQLGMGWLWQYREECQDHGEGRGVPYAKGTTRKLGPTVTLKGVPTLEEGKLLQHTDVRPDQKGKGRKGGSTQWKVRGSR